MLTRIEHKNLLYSQSIFSVRFKSDHNMTKSSLITKLLFDFACTNVYLEHLYVLTNNMQDVFRK